MLNQVPKSLSRFAPAPLKRGGKSLRLACGSPPPLKRGGKSLRVLVPRLAPRLVPLFKGYCPVIVPFFKGYCPVLVPLFKGGTKGGFKGRIKEGVWEKI